MYLGTLHDVTKDSNKYTNRGEDGDGLDVDEENNMRYTKNTYHR